MSWKSDKVITVYPNGVGILEVIEELNKGARVLEKYTLKEQMELIEKKIVLRGGEIGKRGLLLAEELVVRIHPPQPIVEQLFIYIL